MVMLLKNPGLPSVPESETTTAELVLAPLMMVQFRNVSLLIGVAPTEPNNRTLGDVTLVLVMVRLRTLPAGELAPNEPSTVTLLPRKRRSAPANEPVIECADPVG